MAKKKGKGWHGQSKRHSLAAKKGRSGSKPKGAKGRTSNVHKLAQRRSAMRVRKAKGLTGSGVAVKKLGSGKVGKKTVSPTGKYIHVKHTSAKNYSKFKSIKTKSGKVLRLGLSKKTGKWEKHSTLTPIKLKKK